MHVEVIERFAASVDAELRSLSRDQPARLVVAGRPMLVYGWKLTVDRVHRPGWRRIVMRRSDEGPLAWEAGPPLLLGYDDVLETFAAWQAEVRPTPAPSSSAWIPVDLLHRARVEGLAAETGRARRRDQPGREVLTAFVPEEARRYVQLLDSLHAGASPETVMLEHELMRARDDPGFREAFYLPSIAYDDGPGRSDQPDELVHGMVDEEEEFEYTPIAGRPIERPARVVNTGFDDGAGSDVPVWRPLRPGRDYRFWFSLGPWDAASIETRPVDVEGVEDGEELVIALFGFPDGLQPVSDARIGRMIVRGERGVPVEAPEIEGSRLIFPVSAPERTCDARLRVNLYCRGVLVQSRLVVARVGRRAPRGLALRSDLDPEYALSKTLDPATLADIPGADLSLSVNGNGATHQVRFYADQDRWTADLSLDAARLKGLIDGCRQTLREVSWGTREEWTKSDKSAYDQGLTAAARHDRLLQLAAMGRNCFTTLAKALSHGDAAGFQNRVQAPVRVEVAARAEMFLPAAMFYDHRLDTGTAAPIGACPAFAEWLASGDPPAQSECLGGECPSRLDQRILCPSGFWGFRHEIGWPVSSEADATGVVGEGDTAAACVGIGHDLQGADAHLRVLQSFLPSVGLVRTRGELFEQLLRRDDSIVYLYCHGGATDAETAYLRLDPGEDADVVNYSLLYDLAEDLGARLEERRPLVFLNGCRTGAVEPQARFGLVQSFTDSLAAVGVIATETTVFEPMASAFAEHFLGAFVRDGATVGAAVRHARLELLRAGNPLGLTYVPFVLSGTRLAA